MDVQFDPQIVTIALAAAAIAKILVDMVRMSNRLPSWASPLLAVGFGIAAAFLLLVANGTIVNGQTAAQAMVAGILAAGAAVGATELQKHEPAAASATPLLFAPIEIAAPGPREGSGA
ncbi:MAG: hypothetical protein EI684_05140 [Candidatus Viridilinea halotolerans]|uniref:Holin n=1 Tax=Candidatus Viridilinea halotolerans TaxID=2491704 RepID=A0A426U5V7_9CHLR|nr:MAG: hypothetical protein EI684_05140 [Candidatus Viridilinea halotolerans]